MALVFDDKGNLQPYGVIEADLADFEKAFVFNDLRKALFESYLLYLKDLRAAIGSKTSFFQWVNGRYVSKQESTKDIDLITFVDYQTFEAKGKINGLDCYLVQSFPENHRKFLPYQMERLYWLDLYTLSNPKYGKPQPKGFVQLNF